MVWHMAKWPPSQGCNRDRILNAHRLPTLGRCHWGKYSYTVPLTATNGLQVCTSTNQLDRSWDLTPNWISKCAHVTRSCNIFLPHLCSMLGYCGRCDNTRGARSNADQLEYQHWRILPQGDKCWQRKPAVSNTWRQGNCPAIVAITWMSFHAAKR